MRGTNIINFSNFVDEIIDSSQINKILELLEKNDLKEMNDIKCRLSKYNNCINLFNKEFIKAKKESIFEFSIISLVVIEREDFETFEKEREKCPNRVDRILYHGTSIKPISNILTGLYRKSIEKKKLLMEKEFISQIYWIMPGIMGVKMVIEQIFQVFQKLMILLQ